MKSALDFALARLARRAHSQGELTAKLERAGFKAPDITSTLAKLRAWRYLDDQAFAASFARSASERKHWGPARVTRALRVRGLADHHIDAALSETFLQGEAEPIERALARFRRICRRRGGPEQQKARAYRHLLARGFSPGAIMEALGNESSIEENDTQ